MNVICFQATVDSAASNTVVDESLANQLWIKMTTTEEVEPANRSVEKVGAGSAEAEIEGIGTVDPDMPAEGI